MRLDDGARPARRDVPRPRRRRRGAARGRRCRAAPRTASACAQRLGLGEAERLDIARCDGATLHLPPVLDCCRSGRATRRSTNGSPPGSPCRSRLAAGPATRCRPTLARLRAAVVQTARLLAALPGLRALHARPRRGAPQAPAARAACPATRRRWRRPWAPRSVTRRRCTARRRRCSTRPCRSTASSAGRRYRPFLPVPLWGEVRPRSRPRWSGTRAEEPEGRGGRPRLPHVAARARRRKSDEPGAAIRCCSTASRTSSAWPRWSTSHRAAEDDDEAGARQGRRGPGRAGDRRAPAPRRDAGCRWSSTCRPRPRRTRRSRRRELTYPEWDHRAGRYRPAIAASSPSPSPETAGRGLEPGRGRTAPHPPGAPAVRGAAARGAEILRAQAGWRTSSTSLPWCEPAPTAAPARRGSDRVYIAARNAAA